MVTLATQVFLASVAIQASLDTQVSLVSVVTAE